MNLEEEAANWRFEHLTPEQQAEWRRLDAEIRDAQAIIEAPTAPSLYRLLSGDEIREVLEDAKHPRHQEVLRGLGAALDTKRVIAEALAYFRNRKPGDATEPLTTNDYRRLRAAIARELGRVRHGWTPRIDFSAIFTDAAEIDRALANESLRSHLLAAIDESVVRRAEWQRTAARREQERGNPIFRQ
jgi:hypothetical protein